MALKKRKILSWNEFKGKKSPGLEKGENDYIKHHKDGLKTMSEKEIYGKSVAKKDEALADLLENIWDDTIRKMTKGREEITPSWPILNTDYQKIYKTVLQKLKKYKGKLGDSVFDYLENDNYHNLNGLLTVNGYFKNETASHGFMMKHYKHMIVESVSESKEDLVDDIMAWEGGEMTEEEEAKFFQKLINNGMAWTLQGTYGRTAKALIDAGLCHPKDKNKKIEEAATATEKPVADIEAHDGNISATLGVCTKALRKAQMQDRADELMHKVLDAQSKGADYNACLEIMDEYCDLK